MDTISIDLAYLPALGQLSLISAEWWDQRSRFVVFRYALDERPMTFGIAMDLDKGVLLDRVTDDDADRVVEQGKLEQCRATLWKIALEARHLVEQDTDPDEVKRTRQHDWTESMISVLSPPKAVPSRSAF